MYSKALVVASGNLKSPGIFEEAYREADLIIAADGGLRHLQALGLKPHILVGDMDSAEEFGLNAAYRAELEASGVEVFKLNVKKDESDMEKAIEIAKEKGAREIILLAAIGNRMDHSLFNINLAFDLRLKGYDVRLYDGLQELSPLVSGDEMEIKNREGLTLSIVPYTNMRGLSLIGFDYPLTEVDLPYTKTLTSSNVVNTASSLIKLKEGRALVVISEGH